MAYWIMPSFWNNPLPDIAVIFALFLLAQAELKWGKARLIGNRYVMTVVWSYKFLVLVGSCFFLYISIMLWFTGSPSYFVYFASFSFTCFSATVTAGLWCRTVTYDSSGVRFRSLQSVVLRYHSMVAWSAVRKIHIRHSTIIVHTDLDCHKIYLEITKGARDFIQYVITMYPNIVIEDDNGYVR